MTAEPVYLPDNRVPPSAAHRRSAGDHRLMASVTLSDAQVKALPTSPVVLVPAPSANVLLVPERVVIRVGRLAAYTNIDPDSRIWIGASSESYFKNVALNQAHYDDDSALDTPYTGLDDALAGSGTTWSLVMGFAIPTADSAGEALVIAADNNAAGDFTGGSEANSLTVDLWFSSVLLS